MTDIRTVLKLENYDLRAAIITLSEHLENANTAATSLQIQNIKLIRGSESMQADAVNNTATIQLLKEHLSNRDKEITQLKEHLSNRDKEITQLKEKVRYAYIQIEALEAK